MHTRSVPVLGAALWLAALHACDCAGPVHVDDASLRPRADASRDATVLDVTAPDAAAVDTSFVDGGAQDSATLDTAVLDATTADAGGAPDASPLDVPADSGSSVDAPLEDGHAADSGQAVQDCATGGLCLSLTWSSEQGDLDLHLSFNGGAWCSDDACYWANCADDASYHVDWDQSGGLSSADPVVYHSGRIGHGPEILRLDDPLQATYTAAVHYQPGLSLTDVTAVVELWSLGVKLATQAHTLAPGAFWELGDILVGASSVSTTPASRLCGSGVWMCQDPVHGCPAE